MVNTCADSLKFLFRSDQNPDVKSAVCPCRLTHTSFFQTCQVTRPLAINSLVHKFQQKNGQVKIKDGKSCLNHLLHLHVTSGNFAKFIDFAVISAKRSLCVQLWCIRSMQQAVKKDGVDGCDFDLSRMSHASVDREGPKPEFMHVGENISVNSSESWVSPKGKKTKNGGLCLFPPTTSHIYIHIEWTKTM